MANFLTNAYKFNQRAIQVCFIKLYTLGTKGLRKYILFKFKCHVNILTS